MPDSIPIADTPLAVFRHAYFGQIDQYLAWHDGYEADQACLTALSPVERNQAEAELLAALRNRTADARAVMGLGYLRSEEALPLLHHCLRQGFYAHYVLTAIASINPAGLDRMWLDNVLTTTTNTYNLIDVLMGLPDAFALPQVGAGVATAALRHFTHPDYLVRYHALNALRKLYGVPGPQPSHSPAAIRADALFGLICQKHAPRAYRQAQQLFISQVPAATLREFPLTATGLK
ncbi:hypothetical protein [Hymenobacter negativus]|uniref:HEAT repeat domain-containing protein n=1 Tax=Hymenobacter negativus TaxID=2795026 RepID=A0ABS3Q9E0_9BACT|nr:hypothetical protein [Hymenobacter negativus]MBO2007623.1 hypothetical protein [Hymenobacter negativus]